MQVFAHVGVQPVEVQAALAQRRSSGSWQSRLRRRLAASRKCWKR